MKLCNNSRALAWLLATNITLIGMAALFCAPPKRNEVLVTGRVMTVETVTAVSCIIRIALPDDEPGQNLDIIARQSICVEAVQSLRKIVDVRGQCAPILTVYGYQCQILAESIKVSPK
jgi:hypothetical protein